MNTSADFLIILKRVQKQLRYLQDIVGFKDGVHQLKLPLEECEAQALIDLIDVFQISRKV